MSHGASRKLLLAVVIGFGIMGERLAAATHGAMSGDSAARAALIVVGEVRSTAVDP